jgi:hypothetical protein
MGLQCGDDFFGGTGHFPRWVDVLDAQEPVAPGCQRLKIAGSSGYK